MQHQHTLALENLISDLNSDDSTCVRNALVESAEMIIKLPGENVIPLRQCLYRVSKDTRFELELRSTIFWVLSKRPFVDDLEIAANFLELHRQSLHSCSARQIAVLAEEFLIRSDKKLISESTANLSFIREVIKGFPEILSDFDELSEWSGDDAV